MLSLVIRHAARFKFLRMWSLNIKTMKRIAALSNLISIHLVITKRGSEVGLGYSCRDPKNADILRNY